MANEDKKDFNAMLHKDTDMPKVQIVTDEKTIQKYGGSRMYFAPPVHYDEVMKRIPEGRLTTVGESAVTLRGAMVLILQTLSQPASSYP